jgi:hypothetical protein
MASEVHFRIDHSREQILADEIDLSRRRRQQRIFANGRNLAVAYGDAAFYGARRGYD